MIDIRPTIGHYLYRVYLHEGPVDTATVEVPPDRPPSGSDVPGRAWCGPVLNRREDTPGELPQFDRSLRGHLATLVDSDLQLLRAMLVAPGPGPSCLFAGPRGADPRAWEADDRVSVPEIDHGIVLRGPHPECPNRQILVAAGTRAAGTGAACFVATRPRFIREMRNRLLDVDLADKSKTIWALVSGRTPRTITCPASW